MGLMLEKAEIELELLWYTWETSSLNVYTVKPPSGEIGGWTHIKTWLSNIRKETHERKAENHQNFPTMSFKFWVGFQTGAWFWWLTELFNESLDWFSHLGLKKSGTTTETKRRRNARLLRWKHSEHKHCKIPKLAVELFQNNKDEEDFLSVNLQQNTIYFDFDHDLYKHTLWPESKKNGSKEGWRHRAAFHSSLSHLGSFSSSETSNSSLTELNPYQPVEAEEEMCCYPIDFI